MFVHTLLLFISYLCIIFVDEQKYNTMKTKVLLKSFAFCLVAICSVCANAQISTNELPPSFSSSLFSTRSSDVINLPVPDVAEALHEDSLFADADIPYRVGLPLAVSYNLQNSGHWQVLGDSVRVWRLQLHAAGAKAMTVSYDKFWIPEGAKFFVYNADKTFCIGAFTSFNNKGMRESPVDFATGFVAGDNIVLEYYEPIEAETGGISVERVIYVYKNVLAAQSNVMHGVTPGTSMSCNVNINCPEGDDWQKEKRAVAAIYDGIGALCTGALINNTGNKDYFLSADHCFSSRYDAQGANQMNQLIFYWNYESPDCSNTYIYNPPSSAGAKLVANNSHSDFALLELTESVKNVNGYMPYYLGWTRSNVAAANAVGIHHPRGDIKKISVENNAVTSYDRIQNWVDGNGNIISTTQKNTHWKVVFDVGTTEGGSSGSPLMNQNHLVVGQLHGGDSGCAPITKYYGRFDVSWDYGGVATRRLKDWLDPGNTGIMQITGRGMKIVGSEYVCDNAVYSIESLPNNLAVVWECNSIDLTLLANSPYANQCTVENSGNRNLNAVLTAKIKYDGNIIATLTKTIIASYGSLSGYYRQESCIFYNVSHPAISTTDINRQTANFVHQGCMVYLTLYGINSRRVYHSGMTPDVWYYNGSTQIQFQLPLGSGGIPFYVEIGDDGSCNKRRFLFFSVSNNGNISSKSLKIVSSGAQKDITIISEQRERVQDIVNWNLEIYDTSYGNKVCDVKNLINTTYQLNTSGWIPGLYVVRAVIGDEVLTEKITVGK